jgi:RNA polymerase primary sigma factor
MNDLIGKWKKTKENLSQKLKRIPSNEEIAKKLGLNKTKMDHILFWLSTSTSSLDAPVGDEGDSQVLDLVENQTAVSPDRQIEHFMDKERVSNLMEIMSERERQILDMRFGLADGKSYTLAEVAEALGVSRERIRQIEEAALDKLRKFVQKQDG